MIQLVHTSSLGSDLDNNCILQTVTALLSFFLAMVLHPDAQSRAQTEIDNVVGTGRLPNFGDETLLPYVSALVEEVMRWHPVAPVGPHYTAFFLFVKQLTFCVVFGPPGVPHRLTVDDVYEGYFLPAGSIVIGNAW